MVRRRAYWSLLSGAFGFTYGHACVWCSVGERERNFMSPITWQEALGNAGADQMRHLRAFMESLQPMTAVPCQQIFVEGSRREGTLDTHAQAASAKNYVCIYLPAGGSAELDLSTVWKNSSVNIWYWDPRSGEFSAPAGQSTTMENGHLTVKTPTEGEEQDWIILLTTESITAPILPFVGTENIAQEEAKKVFAW